MKKKAFSRIRIEMARINYLDYKSYRARFENIPKNLIKEWERIERRYEALTKRA